MLFAYGSIKLMNTYVDYLVILITVGVGFSAAKSGLDAWISSEDTSTVWRKIRIKVIAAVIGVGIVGTVAVIKKYYN